MGQKTIFEIFSRKPELWLVMGKSLGKLMHLKKLTLDEVREYVDGARWNFIRWALIDYEKPRKQWDDHDVYMQTWKPKTRKEIPAQWFAQQQIWLEGVEPY